MQTSSQAHQASSSLGYWKVFPLAFKRPERVAVHTSASSPEFKNEWSSSSASPLSFNCYVTGHIECSYYGILCANDVCSDLSDKSRAKFLSQFHLGLYDSRNLEHETFSWLGPYCILGFMSVVWYLFYHFNFIDFTRFTLGAMYSTSQHVVYATLLIIPMSCYTLHNMLFLWHYIPFLCGLISGFSFMWNFLPITRNSFKRRWFIWPYAPFSRTL